uniref:Head to tail connecting protein n=1 Tax=Siphoviridae sp. ctFgp7 TaxID=2827821 RepID=A0A8S5ST72_9CAUD|nr:MAG TPA: head to tail connecting protein [Siphoviridae sp. ctFgp7]
MAETLAKKIKRRFEALRAERQNWSNLWQDVSEFVLPRKADFIVKQTPGKVRTKKIFDTTATNSAELLAGAVHGMLTNSAVPWFRLRFADKRLNEKAENKRFLDDAGDAILQEINRPDAAFVTNIHEVYLDLAVLGTAALYVGWNDEKDCLDFRSIFLNEIYIDEDERGNVDTVFRVYKADVRLLSKQFGAENLPDELKNDLSAERFDRKYRIIHAIYPNARYSGGLKTMGINYPWRSVYLLEEKECVLQEGGYEELPILVVRWTKSSSETYGRSPAISALPDIKMLQTMMRDTLEAAAKANNPPYFVHDENSILPQVVLPGQFIYVDDEPKAMEVGRMLPYNDVITEATRQRIRTAFYNDALQLTGGARMTATEVLQRTEEKRRLMAPVLGRLEQELLGPMIARVFRLLYARGVIRLPEGATPDNFPGMRVEYVSPMAVAQKQEQAQSVLMAVQTAGAVSQTVKSTGSIVVDGEIAERKVIEAYGLEEIARSEEDVRKILQAQEQMLQAQAQAASQVQDLQNAQTVADIGKTAQEAENLRGSAK